MAKYEWREFEETYRSFIEEVSDNNSVDMGVARDMLIKMVCEPDDQLREEAIEAYGPIPEGLDKDAFLEDFLDIIGDEE